MAENKKNAIIVGAGQGGTALLEMFKDSDTINVLCIVDNRQDAPGLKLAKTLGIKTYSDYKKCLSEKHIKISVNEIINVTGVETIQNDLLNIAPKGVEVIGGMSAKLMWEIVEKHVGLENKLERETIFMNNIIESLTHPFYVIDANDYTIKLANSAAGFSELTDESTCYGLTHNRKTPCTGEHRCPLEEVKRTKESVIMEHEHFDREGNPRYYEVHGYPIADENGNVIQMIEYSLDITERKKAEEDIKESEGRYRSLFENAAEGILVADIETMTFKYANPAICTMLGYQESELIRMGVSDIYPVEHLEHVISEFQVQASGEKALAMNIPCLRKDGTVVYTDVNTTKILMGKRNYNVGFFTDITERKEMEEVKNGLIIDVTHELKSPIALMEMAYDMCERGVKAKDFKRIEDAQHIGAVNLKRFSEDVHNILDMFAVGIKRETKKRISLGELVAAVVKDLRLLTEGTGVEVRVDISDDADSIEMPEREAACVVRNIVGNAVKFTKKGTIDIASRRKGAWVEVSVKDTGCGIIKDDMDHIFDRFFKGSSMMPGTGLGLALCKKVVELSGGTIEARSDGEWKGTTVTVTLPRG